MYKLYALNKLTGMEKISEKKDEKEIYEIASKIKPKEYYTYTIVRNIGNGDEIIEFVDFTREVKVEAVDNFKSKYKVQATTFTPEQRKRPSKMKQKEELRKLTEDYVER